MWYWIKMIALIFSFLIIFEELSHYGWRRYVYGKKPKSQRRWLHWLVHWVEKRKGQHQNDVQM